MSNVTLENEIARASETATAQSHEPNRAPRHAAAARAYPIAALFGGLLVFAVEAVDRLVTLAPSFNSAAEPFLYAAYLAPALLLGLVGGLGLAPGANVAIPISAPPTSPLASEMPALTRPAAVLSPGTGTMLTMSAAP